MEDGQAYFTAQRDALKTPPSDDYTSVCLGTFGQGPAPSPQLKPVQQVEQERQFAFKEIAMHLLSTSVDVTPQPLQVVQGASGWQEWQVRAEESTRATMPITRHAEETCGLW